MELRQLNTFRMVAHALSFSRAASALNYVQSSVTTQIQGLEEELGTRLFDRLGKRVALTQAGERFLQYSERILNLVDEARSVVDQDEEVKGSVSISAPESLCTYVLPGILQQFRSRYPQARVIFRPLLDFGNIRNSVNEGTVDIAFMIDEAISSTSLVIEGLFQEPLLLLVSPDHSLAGVESLQDEQLQKELFLLTERGCGYRNILERALNAEGMDTISDLEFFSVEAIKQCAMVGMGIAFLPRMVVATELEQGRLVALPWEDHKFEVSIQMIWHKEKWLSPAMKAFIEITNEILHFQQALVVK
jgi:DNA-binding transcriptional LysR family regulator